MAFYLVRLKDRSAEQQILPIWQNPMSTFDDKSGAKCARFFDLSFPQSGCGRSEAKFDGVACRKFS
jgi:hypothetical protein